MVIDSDRLSLLGPAEKDLLGRALALRGRTARVSGLLGEYGEDAYLIEGRGGKGEDFELAANLSDGERSIKGRSIPLARHNCYSPAAGMAKRAFGGERDQAGSGKLREARHKEPPLAQIRT